MIVLGAGLAQVSNIERAEYYLGVLLETDDLRPIQRAVGYRTLANIIFLKGEEYFGTAHDYYNMAITALEGITNLPARLELANIQIMQARLNIAEYKIDDARTNISKAWGTIRALPCMESLAYLVTTAHRYTKLVQIPDPPLSEPCVFFEGSLSAAYVDQFIGNFQAADGTRLEIAFDGTQLLLRLAGQVHYLIQIRDGMYGINNFPAYFVLFRQHRNEKFYSITFYQPNGVFHAQRV